MKKINIHSSSFDGVIRTITESMDLSIREEHAEIIAEIKTDDHSSGHLRAMEFRDGVYLLVIDGKFDEELELILSGELSRFLQFNHCQQGWTRQVFDEERIQCVLNPMAGAIIANPKDSTQQIFLPADDHIQIISLFIDRKIFRKSYSKPKEQGLPQPLEKVLTDVNGENAFLYINEYSFACEDCIRKLLSNEHQGLVRSFFMAGKVMELLSLQINDYKKEYWSPGIKSRLRQFDLEKIVQARDRLVEDLQNPPTIPELAKAVGVNQQKLKNGFKETFNHTINTYLRNVRLERARLLLVEESYKIRDVAHMIGYANSSYFAKQFRKKFGISPKDFRKLAKSPSQNRKELN